MPELLIGCGNRRDKIVGFQGRKAWEDMTSLDIDPTCNPDVVHDLETFPYPFEDNTFDEIHAYECLEHMGTQGDYKFFFAQFSEFHRILKPGGLFIASVPTAETCLTGDPGHKRIIARNTLGFLRQETYDKVGDTPVTDYRSIYKVSFNLVWVDEGETHPVNFFFCLQAV